VSAHHNRCCCGATTLSKLPDSIPTRTSTALLLGASSGLKEQVSELSLAISSCLIRMPSSRALSTSTFAPESAKSSGESLCCEVHSQSLDGLMRQGVVTALLALSPSPTKIELEELSGAITSAAKVKLLTLAQKMSRRIAPVHDPSTPSWQSAAGAPGSST